MDKLLIINANPKTDINTSFSLQVAEHFLKTYKKVCPTETFERIDLYREEIPVVDQTVLDAWDRLRKGEDLSAEQKRITERMGEILKQFKNAMKYVIVMPLFNFNIPSKLKDYMDNILIARETFKYTENGSVGLLTDGRKLLVIQGSGAIYTNDDWYTEVEYSHKYLKSMFNFIGVQDYTIIRAQGTSLLNKEDILSKANKEADVAAAHMANKANVPVG